MRGITPYLQVVNTGKAIAWYEQVFCAREVRARLVAPDGTCMNAEIEIEGTRLMLADEMRKVGSSSPATLGGTSVVLDLHVADCDCVFQKAIDAGAKEIGLGHRLPACAAWCAAGTAILWPQGCWRQGCRHRVYKEVFTTSLEVKG